MARKTTIWAIQVTNNEISKEKTWKWIRKGRLKQENWISSDSSTQLRKDSVKARIDKTQQNSTYRLFGDRDEMNYLINMEMQKISAKKNVRLEITWWRLWSTGNCVRSLNLTIGKIGTCTTQNSSWKMRCTNFFWILRYKRFIYSRSDLEIVNKKKIKIKNN